MKKGFCVLVAGQTPAFLVLFVGMATAMGRAQIVTESVANVLNESAVIVKNRFALPDGVFITAGVQYKLGIALLQQERLWSKKRRVPQKVQPWPIT